MGHAERRSCHKSGDRTSLGTFSCSLTLDWLNNNKISPNTPRISYWFLQDRTSRSFFSTHLGLTLVPQNFQGWLFLFFFSVLTEIVEVYKLYIGVLNIPSLNSPAFTKPAIHQDNLLILFILTVSNAAIIELNHVLASSTTHSFN